MRLRLRSPQPERSTGNAGESHSTVLYNLILLGLFVEGEHGNSSNPAHRAPHCEGFWRIVVISLMTLLFNSATFLLHIAPLSSHKIYPPAVLSVIAAILAFSSAVLDRSMWRADARMGVMRWPRPRFAVKQTIFVCALGSIIAALSTITLKGIKSEREIEGTTLYKIATTTVSCL